jgi:hypothetical protein
VPTQTCPHCKKSGDVESLVCPHCGAPNHRFEWKGNLGGTLTGLVFFLLALALFATNTEAGSAMGSVLFLLLPTACGFAVALCTRPGRVAITSLLLAALISFLILLVTKKEGLVCVLMALPLVAGGLALGVLLRKLVGKAHGKWAASQNNRLTSLIVLPLIVLAANAVERPFREVPRIESYITVYSLDAPPQKVWELLRSVDHVGGPQPFLMKIGLPAPQRCALLGSSVGGIRICYFDSGTIEERITEWDPPRGMGLQIVANNLPGRHWLGFKDARYDLRQDGDQTVLTRRTTITSRLYPAWYWRRLENLGIQTEHQYVFDDLARRLAVAAR